MSEEVKESNEQEDVRGLTELLETLVPPKNLEIEDIYGNIYKVSSSVSARSQIKIMREFDKLKELENEVNIQLTDMPSIIQSLVSLASDENVFNALCNCFEIAHAKTVKRAKEESKKEDDLFEHVGDLFSIEEIVSGIIPLFIRLARKTTKLIQVLS